MYLIQCTHRIHIYPLYKCNLMLLLYTCYFVNSIFQNKYVQYSCINKKVIQSCCICVLHTPLFLFTVNLQSPGEQRRIKPTELQMSKHLLHLPCQWNLTGCVWIVDLQPFDSSLRKGTRCFAMTVNLSTAISESINC